MTALTIQKHTAINFLGLLFSIAYGFFIIASLQRLYLLDGSDIAQYVSFFQRYDLAVSFSNFSIRGDGVFRVGVNLIIEYFDTEIITIFSSIAFITSSIIFCIFSRNIRSSKYFKTILPLFLMVFLTPMVINLFASQIRSTIAFTLLSFAMIYSKGAVKYILFGLSSLIHFAMIPMISLYILFHTLNRIRIRSPFIIPLSILLVISFLIAIASYTLNFNITAVSQGILFNFLVFYIVLLIIFTNKKAVKNVYGFISIALMLVYLFGQIIDISFVRYIGYAIILYLFFLIEKGELGTIQVFTVGYIPFFTLISYYAISNVA